MKKPDIKSESAKRIARTEAYADKVRQLFAKTVNAILTMNKTMPTLDEGVMFSFDAQSMKMQKQVEQLLRQLHSVATMAIRQGIALEWEQANAECDKLVQSCFGKKILESTEFSAWTQRNTKARDAFMNRSDNGLNLSDKIWKDVRQLRDEMEVAMTVAIGEGDSASSMSRKVREYLNDPDLMFRRFRYKDESGEWQRKWKKRIKDPKTGKVKWIDYDRDSYKTGAGVYKSSAKNAMRVARTETNIAYRRADNERWLQMDFVLGQRIQLSKSHPKKDICDKLVGDYPKDFVFDGWHPQCFCFATPITIPPEETAHLTEIFLNGGDWRAELRKLKSGREIKSYPQGFKDWVTEHADQIEASRSRGTEPYFIKNNSSVIDGILAPTEKKPTPLEIAKQRHANRTPEQEEAIRAKWQERKKRIAAEKQAASPSRLMPDELKAKSAYLDGEDYKFAKDFFDLIDPKKPIRLEIKKSDSGSYSSLAGDLVHIAGEKRGKASPWERKAVIYHEYGHCIDAQRNLWRDTKLIAMREAQIKMLKAKKEYQVWVEKWNQVNGGWYFAKVTKTMPMAEYIDNKLQEILRRVAKMKPETFARRGITKADLTEQIGSTRDTIKSLVVKYGYGHSTGYFKKPRMKETEYLAHAFENAFLGNRVFQKYLPDIYAEMVDYIKAITASPEK